MKSVQEEEAGTLTFDIKFCLNGFYANGNMATTHPRQQK